MLRQLSSTLVWLMTEAACRVDVWLWRARFFKTRALAARFIDDGRVRVIRALGEARLDKASRTVKVGEGLVFALGGRLVAIRIEGLGARRGPPAEAQSLYSPLDNSSGTGEAGQH